MWTRLRQIWEYVHSISGIAITSLAIINSLLGIYILSDFFMEVDFSDWFGGFVATVASILVVVCIVGRVCSNRTEAKLYEFQEASCDKSKVDEENGDVELANTLPVSLPPEMCPESSPSPPTEL